MGASGEGSGSTSRRRRGTKVAPAAHPRLCLVTEWRTRRRLVGVPNCPNTAVISFSPHCSGRPLRGRERPGRRNGEYRSLLRFGQPTLRGWWRRRKLHGLDPTRRRAPFSPHEDIGVVLGQGGRRQEAAQRSGARGGHRAQGLRRRAAGGAGGPRGARPALGREHWAARRAGRRAVERQGARQGRQGADPASRRQCKLAGGERHRAGKAGRRRGSRFTWGARGGGWTSRKC